MVWTQEALDERKKLQVLKYKQTYEKNKETILLKAKEKYKEEHPNAKKYTKKENKLTYYLSKKLKKIASD
jgi:ATP sulfurylase